MDVAGALLPFTQVVRPELTIHVQEVLTQADKDVDGHKSKTQIPEINEPSDDELKSPVSKTFENSKSGTETKICAKEVNTKGKSEVKSSDIVKSTNAKKGNSA